MLSNGILFSNILLKINKNPKVSLVAPAYNVKNTLNKLFVRFKIKKWKIF